MADKRAYFKLDVGYMSNPKVLTVIDESPSAALLHIASIGYAAQHLTDGVVPVKALLRMTGASKTDADLLMAAGLWLEGPTAGRAQVHDYLKHQRSSAEVKGASDAAKRAAEARWDAERNAERMPDAKRAASETAMPREEREERERKDESAGLVATTRGDVESICLHLADRIEANGSVRPTITAKWRDAARLMLDKDSRTEHEIHGAIEWCQGDDFWRSNILSMPKLRDKFDTLRLQAQRRAGTGSSRQQETDAIFNAAIARARGAQQ